MHIEAQSANCFSSQYILKLDGRPIGQFRGRWFSEGIDVRLTERLQLHFNKESWLGSKFQLMDATTKETLASGARAGFFGGTWNLKLRNGPAQLVRTSWFSSAYKIQRGEVTIAQAARTDWCSRGWRVEDRTPNNELSKSTLEATDLVFIGLVYHTILQRRQNSQNSS